MKIKLSPDDVRDAIIYWLREGRLAKDWSGATLWEIDIDDDYDEQGGTYWCAEVTLKDSTPDEPVGKQIEHHSAVTVAPRESHEER